MSMTSKVVFIDYGYYIHASIFATLKFPFPSSYIALNMILSDLHKIGVSDNDKVIIAVDSIRSWRKDIDIEYKADRKAKREKFNINWSSEYKKLNRLLENIDISTPFHIIKIDKIEADDIMAVGCRYYNDEVILVTMDSDLYQMFIYPNVKIFNPKKNEYVINTKSPHKMLAQKIQKEKTDNLISPILNKNDFIKRMKIINLMELPIEIERVIIYAFKSMGDKTYDSNIFMYNKLLPKLLGLYTNKKIVSYEHSLNKERRKRSEVRKKRILDKQMTIF